MIVIPRKLNESVVIGKDIIITVIEVVGDKVRLRIDAPMNMSVYRPEVFGGGCRFGASAGELIET